MLDSMQLKNFIQSQIHIKPDFFIRVANIPKEGNGKIQRKKLAQELMFHLNANKKNYLMNTIRH